MTTTPGGSPPQESHLLQFPTSPRSSLHLHHTTPHLGAQEEVEGNHSIFHNEGLSDLEDRLRSLRSKEQRARSRLASGNSQTSGSTSVKTASTLGQDGELDAALCPCCIRTRQTGSERVNSRGCETRMEMEAQGSDLVLSAGMEDFCHCVQIWSRLTLIWLV